MQLIPSIVLASLLGQIPKHTYNLRVFSTFFDFSNYWKGCLDNIYGENVSQIYYIQPQYTPVHVFVKL